MEGIWPQFCIVQTALVASLPACPAKFGLNLSLSHAHAPLYSVSLENSDEYRGGGQAWKDFKKEMLPELSSPKEQTYTRDN